MKRILLIGLAIVLLGFLVSVGWIVGGLPPPGMVLRYGFAPGCSPTGETMKLEGVEFVEISAGCFRMGSTENAKGGDTLGKLCSMFGLPWGDQPEASNEMPVRWVEFPRGFWVARHEITNEQYERFKSDHERNGHSLGDKHPVVNVSWEDAQEYCAWLSKKSGLYVRLPSEAMWEASCRGGSEGEFCFGDDEARLGEFAWCSKNSKRGAQEVGTRRSNGWGLFDLHGNVWEWCEDTYHESYEDAPRDGSAWTEGGEEAWGGVPSRVRRGGCWGGWAGDCRSATRRRNHPGFMNRYLGFRPCLWPLDN